MDGLVFTCQIGRLPGTTFQVADFSLREALSELYHLTLTVVSALDNIVLREQLGMSASLTITRDGVVERTINGIVAGAEQGNTDGRRTWYSFNVRPEMWRMTLNQDSRLFQRQSVPDILKQLLKEHRIRSDSKFYEDEGHHPVREYTTQKRESAYDFWCRLAAEEGITFWFEEDKLFFSNSHLGMLAGIFLTYNPQPETDNTDASAWQWRYGEFLCPDEFTHKDNNFLRPSYPLQHQAMSEPGYGHAVFESYGRFQLDAEGKPLSLLRLNQLNSESKRGTATTNCIQLRPGKIFILSHHPIAAMNDRWQVVSVSHHGAQPQAAGIAGEGTTLTNEVTFIPGWDNWRPPYRYKPQADGDEVATVVGPEGEEIFVNEHGAIKVHFHWNRYDAPGDGSSCWVRVAQGWNGHGFGFMAIPRIGQEVLVSYLNGDIDRPIVTGCTYNGRNRPPLNLPAEKTRTTFRTQTHKGQGFNELRFEDAKDSEEVYIHAQKDFTGQIEHDVCWHIKHDQKQRIDHHHYMDIQGDEHSQVMGSRKYSTEGDISQRITGSQHIQAGDALVSESGQETHHKSGGKIVLEAATEITLKVGGSFLKVTPAGIQSSAINVGQGSGGSGRGVSLQLPEGIPPLPAVKFPLKKYCVLQAQEQVTWVIKPQRGQS
ncbi:type VI secretion system tip protein VgrG [Xenorhabdus bovienii]|uniref:type VI secretion system Vgr family protein n=1 Tax=Xenorhabdus bovienii TaxID=40576 RepID=UPI001EDDF679|nr:type VI secretion system tip protein TssI/VgrG [Xenorhabdus bovienii]MCG3461435.1 type VI secretion system tip protein VgrG [Xenorhabdus bovienii]